MTAGPAPVPAAGHRRTPRVLAVLLAALLLLFSAITIGQSAVAHRITLGSFNAGAGLMLTLWVIAAVGLVVAWHQPGNPIGWLLLAAPASLAVTFASDGYDAAYRPASTPCRCSARRRSSSPSCSSSRSSPSRSSSGCSPTASCPPGRWKWVFWSFLAVTLPGFLSVLGATIAAEAGHHVHVLSDGQLAQVENPSSPVVAGLTQLFLFGLVGGWLGALAWQIASWHRSSGRAPPAAEMADERSRRLRGVRVASFGSSARPCGQY